MISYPVLFLFLIGFLVVVAAVMERSPESREFWDRVAERVFR